LQGGRHRSAKTFVAEPSDSCLLGREGAGGFPDDLPGNSLFAENLFLALVLALGGLGRGAEVSVVEPSGETTLVVARLILVEGEVLPS
jgi:hypothetical protein